MVKRILGIIVLLVGLGGVGLSVAGTVLSWRVVESAGISLDQNLQLLSQTLDNAHNTLTLVKTTIEQTNTGLATVNTTVTHLAQTVNQSRPLLTQVDNIVSKEVPTTLIAVQNTIPNMAEVAGAIDAALSTLSNFQFEQNILGLPITFDLGIEYDPNQRFDDSITAMGESLVGLPEQMQTLSVYLGVADENLGQMSRDITQIAGNLETINNSVQQVQPLLDEYLRIITETNDNLRLMRSNLPARFTQLKTILLIVFIWIGLTQIAPLYLGWEMVRNRPLAQEEAAATSPTPQKMVEKPTATTKKQSRRKKTSRAK